MECLIQILEQPARKVKFRMEVHSHRCQQKELLLGRNSSEDAVLYPTVQIMPSSAGARLRPGTMVRMSLVDIRSAKDNIIEHWHRLVDCKKNALVANWSITKKMDGDGRVTFGNLGIVRTLEKEKVKEVRDRIIERRMEQGIPVRNDKWECTQIENRAEQQCKETSAYRLKLCFEVFLPNERGGIVKVADPVFSEDVVDLTNMNSGELAIKKMSICHDFVEGGAEVMLFTGGDGNVNKISYAKSTFHADFFQINPHDESRIWQHRVTILDNQLHGVGQHLGGVHFCVPPYDRQGKGKPSLIDQETDNVFMELVKTNKNNSTIQAKSDPLAFVYKPSAMARITLKRPRDPSYFENILGRPIKIKAEQPFIPSFNPQDPPIYQFDAEQQNIPQTVHPNIGIEAYDDHGNPFSPSMAMGNMAINSPLSQHPPSPTYPQLLSPISNGLPVSPNRSHVPSPTYSPMLEHRSPAPLPNPENDLDGFLDGTLDLIQITDMNLLGVGGDLNYERYLEDGIVRSACTVAMDGGGGVAREDKREIRRKIKDKKQCRESKRKEDNILTCMSELKISPV